jgi:hypothetical protein
MNRPITVLDRMRIERATWTVDARLQDLPRSSRIAKRRELRLNLRAAAEDVGARQAVRQLGDLHRLASDYLAAEYGEAARRPSWTAAALTFLLMDAAMLILSYLVTSIFRAGVIAADGQATGSYHWHGLPYLLSDERFTFANGSSTSDGGAWTPLVYLLFLAATVIAGRLWRLVPALRRSVPSAARTR